MANKLRIVREKKKLSQKKLADLAGIGQPSIAAYESGARTPTAKSAFLIYNALIPKRDQNLKSFIRFWGFDNIENN